MSAPFDVRMLAARFADGRAELLAEVDDVTLHSISGNRQVVEHAVAVDGWVRATFPRSHYATVVEMRDAARQHFDRVVETRRRWKRAIKLSRQAADLWARMTEPFEMQRLWESDRARHRRRERLAPRLRDRYYRRELALRGRDWWLAV